MRAIETGLLSVECLKGTQTSVHAAGKAFPSPVCVSLPSPPCNRI